MKKLFYMISTVAFVASFASCNKMEQENIPATDDTIVETPAVGETTTITVSSGMQQTKVYLKDNEGVKQTWWNQKDEVILLGGSNASAIAIADLTASVNDFTFTSWPAGVEHEYLVFNGPLASTEENYGGNKVMAPVYDTKDCAITAEVRQKQEITNKSNMSKYANLSVGKVESGENGVFSAEMKNVCGLIKFVFANETTVATSVVIENSGDNFMTGKVKVNYNNGEPTVTEVIEGNKSVEVTSHISDTGDRLLKGSYYACVLPGTYAPKITINLAEGDPIVLQVPEGQTITVNRNEIFDFGVIDNIEPDAGEDPVEPTPTETKTITLDFATQPFTTDVHVHSSAAKGCTELTIFTLVKEEVSYQFEVNSPQRGFCYVSNCLRLVCDGTASGSNYGYIKLPGLDGFTLSGINITSGNGTNIKDYYIFDNDPLTATSAEDAVHTFKLRNNEPFEVNLYGKTAVGEGCYLAALGKNAQFSKLVLTYTKVN